MNGVHPDSVHHRDIKLCVPDCVMSSQTNLSDKMTAGLPLPRADDEGLKRSNEVANSAAGVGRVQKKLDIWDTVDWKC